MYFPLEPYYPHCNFNKRVIHPVLKILIDAISDPQHDKK